VSAAGPPAAGAEEAARLLFGELARTRDLQRARTALERLLALGPAVLPVARAELGASQAAPLLAAARTCLVAGDDADRAAVAERLTRWLPAEVATELLAELLARDPVLATPQYLCGLLDHAAAAMRSAAFKALEERRASVPLQALAPLLQAERAAARAAALELVARLDDPLAWNLVASRFGDPSARIARRAAELLAAVDRAEPLLLERAFPAEASRSVLAWDRARAYALLALVEREEARSLVLLEGRDVEARVEDLRAGLTSAQPLVAGACAVALARIGFRAGPSRVGAWLEREVPHLLVRSASGAEFHSDFSALEGPALRALALLTGEAFGADGDAWRRYWVEHAQGFRARHALIELTSGAARELEVAFRDAEGRAWRLLGPGRAVAIRTESTRVPETPAGTAGPTELLLDLRAAERVLALLEGAGVLGPGRFPSARAGAECALAVAVGAQEKRFAGTPGERWLEDLRGELERVVEEHRWQAYLDPTGAGLLAGESGEIERWAALAPWERQRALVELLLEALRRTPLAARDEPVSELVRLYEDAALPAASDFEPLLAALADERAFGPRAGALCELARVAGGVHAGAARAGEDDSRERLLALGLERFGPEADPALASVARDLEPAALLALARDPRPRARALSAEGLVRALAATERPALARALLADPEPSVQLAVLRVLASSDVALAEELRAEVAQRARAAPLELRIAALRTLARRGGKDAHDLALEALGDEVEAVQEAGVAALAELADPRSASLLASLLARGPSSPLFAQARHGLARMGPRGREACERLARSSGARARREGALFLAEELAPEAAGLLLALLHEEPKDERLAFELSVLSGLDLAAEEHPAEAAQAWWELVVHDDPLAWLLAAAERAGVPAPAREALENGTGGLTAEGARFLLALAELPEAPLVERAARELELRLGVRLSRPATSARRAQFRAELREAVRARLGE
jgi:hypothetical protein